MYLGRNSTSLRADAAAAIKVVNNFPLSLRSTLQVGTAWCLCITKSLQKNSLLPDGVCMLCNLPVQRSN